MKTDYLVFCWLNGGQRGGMYDFLAGVRSIEAAHVKFTFLQWEAIGCGFKGHVVKLDDDGRLTMVAEYGNARWTECHDVLPHAQTRHESEKYFVFSWLRGAHHLGNDAQGGGWDFDRVHSSVDEAKATLLTPAQKAHVVKWHDDGQLAIVAEYEGRMWMECNILLT